MPVPVKVPYRLRDDQRVDIEGQEETVEEVVGQNVVKEFTVDDENIVQVVQVVEVLGYQVTQLPPVPMSGSQRRKTLRCSMIIVHYYYYMCRFLICHSFVYYIEV